MPINYTAYAVVKVFSPFGSPEPHRKVADGELGKMIPVVLGAHGARL